MAKLSGDMLRGHLDTMVLATLGADEAHGYEIMRRLNERGEGSLHMKEGALYPVLYRLERKGFLSVRWDEDGEKRKGPARRLYRLTPAGKKELVSRRDAWRDFVHVVGGIVEA